MFTVKQGRIWIDESGSTKPVSALDFWAQHKTIPVSENLDIIGYAGIKLALVSGPKLEIQILLTTEVGVLKAPMNLGFDWDSCVAEGYWVPLKPTAMEAVWGCLNEASVDPSTALSKKQVFGLIKASFNWGVELELPSGLESSLSNAPEVIPSKLLQGEPYPYQKIGINWLCDYFENSLGALLCDEMGLGKTYQILGLLAHAHSKTKGRILIICPATLLANWASEMSKFTPEIVPYIHSGEFRNLNASDLATQSVVITSYDLIVRDLPLFSNLAWTMVVCDEAQALKNRLSQRHNAVARLNSQTKYMVTGTPIENSLTDLWALSNIVYPGLLGEAEEFESLVDDTPGEAHKISKFIAPLILRRRVRDVAQDLPDLVEIDEPLYPSTNFAQAYEAIRGGLDGDPSLRNFLTRQLRLTQVCCYPGFVLENYLDTQDAKFIRLAEILDELRLRDVDKVLIFTTFTKSIDMLLNFISQRYGRDCVSNLDGRGKTSDRQGLVDIFNASSGFQVLIVNPKAGGVGLNITGANHVIHFNRQWNPQLEKQATARAYRRKQEKTVFVHKFFYLGTIEEVINERLLGKEELAETALSKSLSQDEEIYQSKALLISTAKYI